MMTTRFLPEDRVLGQILPTNKGDIGKPTETVVAPPQTVVIRITPTGMERGGQPSDYARQFVALRRSDGEVIKRAVIRVGNRPETIELDVADLRLPKGATLTAQVERVHALIRTAMADYERAGLDRTKQDPVSIQCCSTLSWQFAAVAYDAVRAYEGAAPDRYLSRDLLATARAVEWSPPRIRTYSENELGNEVFEILHAR